ncbi:hypothetical protein ACFW5I_14275 [Streptomyces sp. NPDC058818]|uniref:hypothetical protein n=1 Tax=Streptomyces sp. NPDC058818 TaxID=3346640 RepID=UPI0036B4B0F9
MLRAGLTNARLLTMDPDHPVAHAQSVWRGRIVGLDELGDDPRRVDPSRIGDIEVVATYVDGRAPTRR